MRYYGVNGRLCQLLSGYDNTSKFRLISLLYYCILPTDILQFYFENQYFRLFYSIQMVAVTRILLPGRARIAVVSYKDYSDGEELCTYVPIGSSAQNRNQ